MINGLSGLERGKKNKIKSTTLGAHPQPLSPFFSILQNGWSRPTAQGRARRAQPAWLGPPELPARSPRDARGHRAQPPAGRTGGHTVTAPRAPRAPGECCCRPSALPQRPQPLAGRELILPRGVQRGQSPPRALAAPGAAEKERKLCRKLLLARRSCKRDAFSSKQRCPKFLGALRQADVGNSEESLPSLRIFIPPLFFSPLAPPFIGSESTAGAETSPLPKPSPPLTTPALVPNHSPTRWQQDPKTSRSCFAPTAQHHGGRLGPSPPARRPPGAGELLLPPRLGHPKPLTHHLRGARLHPTEPPGHCED